MNGGDRHYFLRTRRFSTRLGVFHPVQSMEGLLFFALLYGFLRLPVTSWKQTHAPVLGVEYSR
jgi:hypothetical protein